MLLFKHCLKFGTLEILAIFLLLGCIHLLNSISFRIYFQLVSYKVGIYFCLSFLALQPASIHIHLFGELMLIGLRFLLVHINLALELLQLAFMLKSLFQDAALMLLIALSQLFINRLLLFLQLIIELQLYQLELSLHSFLTLLSDHLLPFELGLH